MQIQPRSYVRLISTGVVPARRVNKRTSGCLLTYIQHKQSLLRLPVRRNLIREVWIYIHGEVPSDRFWWIDEREPPLVARNRQNEEEGCLSGVHIWWNAGEHHGSERELREVHQ